jgi:NAD(P)-dependent dehydrogenase (short-subunit alcohol dehydrogenase family)
MSVREEDGAGRRRVAVVTGGGGGIGTAASLELARRGVVVIAMDPGVGVQGEPLHEETAAETVRRIEAEGGTARASTASVTDAEAVRALFADVVREFGALDIVVNTAGILRFGDLFNASEDDWWAVLDCHFNGYLNVLRAALPLMIEAGYGRVVGFTSGVGLARTIAAGPAYGTAKRANAALTWQVGPLLPDGIAVNCLSPIAASRMVRDAMIAGGSSPKGLDLTAMPQPDEMGPAAAYLGSEVFGWCRGQIVFSAGSELTVIAPPRLIEAVRTAEVADFASALGTLVPVVFSPAEGEQRTNGGSNPRFGPVFDQVASGSAAVADSGLQGRPTCLIISDDAGLAGAVADSVESWGMTTLGVGAWRPFDPAAAKVPEGFAAVADILQRAAQVTGQIDAVVVALEQPGTAAHDESRWEGLLEAHSETAAQILSNAAWLRATAEHAANANQAVRIVHVTKATSPSGHTAAQAMAQMARCADDTPSPVPLDAFSVSVETADPTSRPSFGDLVARLANAEDTRAVRGSEFVVGDGWVGLRSHPGPIGTISFGGTAIPAWVNETLKEIVWH